MIQKIRDRLKKEEFLPTALSILVNPLYIIRAGLHQAISDVAPQITGDILDFGCGSKPFETLFTNANSYIGVDIQVSGHNHANSKIDCYYDGKTLPFSNAQFDAVICFEVLEHVFNIDEVMAEIRRVLKPEGILLLSVPFAWDEHETPYDFARYTSYGMRSILERTKFEVVELKKQRLISLLFAKFLLPI